MTIIRHKWHKIRMGLWQCKVCHCMKQAQPFTVGARAFPQYYYYRNGDTLTKLPKCKSTFHNDVMPRKKLILKGHER